MILLSNGLNFSKSKIFDWQAVYKMFQKDLKIPLWYKGKFYDFKLFGPIIFKLIKCM